MSTVIIPEVKSTVKVGDLVKANRQDYCWATRGANPYWKETPITGYVVRVDDDSHATILYASEHCRVDQLFTTYMQVKNITHRLGNDVSMMNVLVRMHNSTCHPNEVIVIAK